MGRFAAIGIALAIAGVGADRARACEPVFGYEPPTNYELIAEADIVVVALAVWEVPRGTFGSSVVLRVSDIIKGHAKVGDLVEVPGFTGHYEGPTAEGELRHTRPGAYGGSCIAFDYAVGRSYVLMLGRTRSGELAIHMYPWARVNDEAQALWVSVVRAYASISALRDEAKEEAALRALRRRALSQGGRGAALAKDIDAHLRAATKWKSAASLERLYREAATAKDRERAVRAIALRGDRASLAFMTERLRETWAAGVPDPSRLHTMVLYFGRQPNDHALALLAAMSLTIRGYERIAIAGILGRLAGPRLQGAIELALTTSTPDEARAFARYFARNPFRSTFALAQIRAHLKRPFTGDFEMTIAAAAMGDPQVLAWAAARSTREPSRPQRPTDDRGKEPDDHRWLAATVVAVSPLPEANALASRIIAERREDFVQLVDGYEYAAHPNARARLREIAALQLNARERRSVDRTATGGWPR
jgi:hypothetical protein